MVVRVDDRHLPEAVDRQGPGIIQLARPAAGAAPGAQGFAVEGKFLDPVVAVLADIEAVIRPDAEVVRIAELARPVSPAAPDAEDLALGIEDLNPVVATVGHEDPVALVDRQGPWAEELAGL